jgi:hypothetical protein
MKISDAILEGKALYVEEFQAKEERPAEDLKPFIDESIFEENDAVLDTNS